MRILELTIDRYPEVLALLQATPGMCVRSSDSLEATQRYLARNPGLSFVAEDEGHIIGCAMSGHDGRRGYLQHVMVAPTHRGRGIGTQLVQRCLAALQAAGIEKVHLEVLASNDIGLRFWENRGWIRRTDTVRYSIIQSSDCNA